MNDWDRAVHTYEPFLILLFSSSFSSSNTDTPAPQLLQAKIDKKKKQVSTF